jgi:hypothetical protein
MEHDDVAEQILIEYGLLEHLVEGLRAALAWPVPGDDLTRKLSTIRFIAQSFGRHLERLLSLEEHDGYLTEVAATCPQLARQVDALGAEHDRLREAARRAVRRVEQCRPTDHAEFAAACDALTALLQQVEEHGRQEMSLLQEALHRDGGGEG